jgi:hypothetical protein
MLLSEIGAQRQLGADRRMPGASHYRQPFGAEPLPPDLLSERQQHVDSRIDRAGRELALELAALDADGTIVMRGALAPILRLRWLSPAAWHFPAFPMLASATAPMRRWRWQRLLAASLCC